MHSAWSTTETQEQKAPTLHEVISALSFALDLTEGAVPGHALRSCLLAMRIAETLSLPTQVLSDLYYAALLKDVGCSSNSARMCQIVSGDDRAVKAGAKLADWTRPNRPELATIRMLWKHVLPGESAWRKTACLLHLAATQHKNNRELIELRCDRGASIVRKIGLNEEIATAVRHLDEHWDGGGYPSSLKGNEIPLLSRLLGIAQHLDVFCMEKGPQAAIDVMLERSGRWFDPALACAAQRLHRSGGLWKYCHPGEDAAIAHAAVLDREPGYQAVLRPENIDSICEAFADVVDAKSPFTYRHSQGVKDAALAIGQAMGLSTSRLQMLRRAALLHDVGKLSVSNSILDKPGKLTDAEFLVVKGHSRLSREILSKVGAFSEIAIVAGDHHEKLDGSGYPYGIKAEQLSLESRLLAVADVYGALSEKRPYREGLDYQQISTIMEKDVPEKFDAGCYEALQAALTHPPVYEAPKPYKLQDALCTLNPVTTKAQTPAQTFPSAQY